MRAIAPTAHLRSAMSRTGAANTSAAELVGQNPEMRFWHAIALFRARRVDAGLAKLREAAGDRNSIELALRLPERIFQLDRDTKEQIRRMLTS